MDILPSYAYNFPKIKQQAPYQIIYKQKTINTRIASTITECTSEIMKFWYLPVLKDNVFQIIRPLVTETVIKFTIKHRNESI